MCLKISVISWLPAKCSISVTAKYLSALKLITLTGKYRVWIISLGYCVDVAGL